MKITIKFLPKNKLTQLNNVCVCVYMCDTKSPFDAHDMIEIGYDMKMDKDRK